jgi:hypothetical protein
LGGGDLGGGDLGGGDLGGGDLGGEDFGGGVGWAGVPEAGGADGEADGLGLGLGLADDGDGDGTAEVVPGWSGTECTGAPGARPGGDAWLEASAVPPAAATATTPSTRAARSGVTLRPRCTLWMAKPCAAGGVAEGHSAASATAASPSFDRPRSSQSGP